MRISDWSSDVCSSDLHARATGVAGQGPPDPVEPGGGQGRRRARRRAQLRWRQQIGSASCRERVCQYVSISVLAVSLKKKTRTDDTHQAVPTTLKYVHIHEEKNYVNKLITR